MEEILREIEELKALLLKPNLKVYTLGEANKAFGIGRKTFEKAIDAGSLKYMKTGTKVYLTESAIKEFVESGIELI